MRNAVARKVTERIVKRMLCYSIEVNVERKTDCKEVRLRNEMKVSDLTRKECSTNGEVVGNKNDGRGQPMLNVFVPHQVRYDHIDRRRRAGLETDSRIVLPKMLHVSKGFPNILIRHA